VLPHDRHIAISQSIKILPLPKFHIFRRSMTMRRKKSLSIPGRAKKCFFGAQPATYLVGCTDDFLTRRAAELEFGHI